MAGVGEITVPVKADVSLTGVKPWYTSRTIVSLIVLIAVNVLARFGVVGADIQAAVESAVGDLLTIVLPALVAIWGRFAASKRVAPPRPPRMPTGIPPAALSLLGWFLWLGGIACGMLLLAGCTPGQTYVQADRATYEAVAPEYRTYVESDSTLSLDQQQRRIRTLETWELRTRAATRPAVPVSR